MGKTFKTYKNTKTKGLVFFLFFYVTVLVHLVIDKKQGRNSMVEIESRLYCCFKCRNVVAIQDDIVDKNFVGPGRARAFLFSHTLNLKEGTPVDRLLITGTHMTADVCCSDCGEMLGWKYYKAYEEENMWKVGKSVIVKSKIEKLVVPPFH